MESTLSALSTVTATTMARTSGGPSLPLLTISKALNRHFSGVRHLHPLLLARSSPAVRRLGGFHATRLTSSNSALRSLGAAVFPVIRRRLQCLSSSSPSFRSISSGGGGAGFGGYNGGSGGGGSDSGDSKSKLGAAASDGVSLPSSDIIILDVGVL